MCNLSEVIEQRGFERGEQSGLERGEENINKLYEYLLDNDMEAEMRRALKDRSYREELLERYSFVTGENA